MDTGRLLIACGPPPCWSTWGQCGASLGGLSRKHWGQLSDWTSPGAHGLQECLPERKGGQEMALVSPTHTQGAWRSRSAHSEPDRPTDRRAWRAASPPPPCLQTRGRSSGPRALSTQGQVQARLSRTPCIPPEPRHRCLVSPRKVWDL